MSYAPQIELQYVSWGLQKEESEIVSNEGFQKSCLFFTVPASFSYFFFFVCVGGENCNGEVMYQKLTPFKLLYKQKG